MVCVQPSLVNAGKYSLGGYLAYDIELYATINPQVFVTKPDQVEV